VTNVEPDIQQSGNVHVGNKAYTANLVGALSDYLDLHNITLRSGHFFNDADNANFATVCVIGDKVNSNLFSGQNAVGKTILFDANNTTIALTVIGVLNEKDRGGFGPDANDSIVVPIQSAQLRVTGTRRFWDFTARSVDVSQTETAADQIWAVMKQQHKLNYKDYVVDTQEGLLKQIDTILIAFQIVFGGVAGLSLLTGGIGIMNIMLVSVTERTREIGIRKAVGATSGAIMAQFVVEAVTVSSTGGAIGTGIGYLVAALIDHVAHKNLPTSVPGWAVILGVGFSAAVGMFFGIYPAFRASRLDPITALRYE
jgi:putative ABC transport system permease protein